VSAAHPSLRSAMDHQFDRPAGGISAGRRQALRQIAFVIVVGVQALLVLAVVASTLGLGHDGGAGIGPGRPPVPVPLPAGASSGVFVRESA
jgi:hypothetical protein